MGRGSVLRMGIGESEHGASGRRGTQDGAVGRHPGTYQQSKTSPLNDNP